jgi:hypothetical protein
MKDGWSQDLKPRSIGQLLDDNFRFYREKFGFLMVSGLCFLIPYHVLSAYINTHYNLADLQTKLQQLQESGAASAAGTDPQTMSFSQFWTPGLTWSLSLTIIYSLLVTPLLYGMIVHMLTNHHLQKKDVNLGDASTHAFHRLVPSIFTTILLGLSYFVIVFGLISIASVIAALVHAAAIPVMILAFTMILCIVVWLSTRLSLVPSVVIEEQMMMMNSFIRSWQLTKQNFWRALGYFLLLFILVGILRSAVLVAATVFVSNPILVAVISTIVDVLIVPFFMLGTANLYVDLQVRHNG